MPTKLPRSAKVVDLGGVAYPFSAHHNEAKESKFGKITHVPKTCTVPSSPPLPTANKASITDNSGERDPVDNSSCHRCSNESQIQTVNEQIVEQNAEGCCAN